MKTAWPIVDSSILMTRLPDSMYCMSVSAYCYLWTRHVGKLALWLSTFDRLYLSLSSLLMTPRTFFLVSPGTCDYEASWYTSSVETILCCDCIPTYAASRTVYTC